MNGFLTDIDGFLIFFYRLTGVTLLDYYLGTAVLALLAVIVGELTMSVAYLANRRRIEGVNDELVKMNNLSVSALKSGNKQGYTSCNKLANELFGKQFFLMITLSAASLWPACFALAWMNSRFAEVTFSLPVKLPLFGDTVGYTFTFIPIFIVAKIAFGRVKHYLPYFRRIKRMTDVYWKNSPKLESFPSLANMAAHKDKGL